MEWFDRLPLELQKSLPIVDALQKTHAVLSQYDSSKVRIAYSGGADSDCIMHMARFLGFDVLAVFYNTGVEMRVTWNQIEHMRSQGYEIEIIKATTPIPTSQKKHGHPFISKKVSDMLERLQRHSFEFRSDGNLDFDTLWAKYPRCKSALRWWTNTHKGKRNNISWNRYLKDFLIEFGLPFKVSGKCCDGAKKEPIKQYAKEHAINLVVMGIRRAEGGARVTAYHNCFVPQKKKSYDMFFPMFWWKNGDRELYEKAFGISHSEAYTTYGLKRTGCAACTLGLQFEHELKMLEEHEPKLHKGVLSIFGPAYDWTRKYKEYADLRAKTKSGALVQLPMFNLLTIEKQPINSF